MARIKKSQNAPEAIDVNKTIDDIWRRSLRRGHSPPELVQMRQQIIKERAQSHLGIIETAARQANLDLTSVFEEARRRNKIKRRKATRVLKTIDAGIAKRAAETRQSHQRLRREYLKDFVANYKAREGNPELKFRFPAGPPRTDAYAAPGCLVGVPPWSEPDLGAWEATARVESSTDAIGAVFYSRIYTDHADCSVSGPAETNLFVALRGPTPRQSFQANSIRVDLWGTGLGSSFLGDDCPDPDPNSTYAYVWLTVSFTQVVRGVVQGPWSSVNLTDRELFGRRGEYADEILIDISADRFPCDMLFRGPAAGGGEVWCYVTLRTRAEAMGSDGRVRLDFETSPHRLELNCVSLIGEYV